jgi:hypothetical protein
MSDPKQRYEAAAHAVQSGVAMEMNFNSKPTDPKHLRTGINIGMSDHASLVRLLCAKGFITEEEYLEAIADGMEAERKAYEEKLRTRFGNRVTLG